MLAEVARIANSGWLGERPSAQATFAAAIPLSGHADSASTKS